VLFWHFVCIGIHPFESQGGGMGWEMGHAGGRCVVGVDLEVVGG
jgi:hypothetical protein